jgi:Na+/H+-dicarboxylate symporter
MTVVRFAMRLAPIAVFGLMAQLTSKIGLGALLGLAVYVGTVLAGLLIMMLLYLSLVWIIAQISPKTFLSSVRETLLLAFSTSSSAAVMPLSIKTAEEAPHVRPSISQLVIPLGATINMNGTALYQGVAAIFLAQVFGVDISLGGMVLIVVLAVGASIGSPATPGVGIIILATILASVGIPPAGIALIMGVDRILDMSRTAVNVCGDLVTSVLLHRWVKESPAVSTVGNA